MTLCIVTRRLRCLGPQKERKKVKGKKERGLLVMVFLARALLHGQLRVPEPKAAFRVEDRCYAALIWGSGGEKAVQARCRAEAWRLSSSTRCGASASEAMGRPAAGQESAVRTGA